MSDIVYRWSCLWCKWHKIQFHEMLHRYLHGMAPDADDESFSSEASASVRGLGGTGSNTDNMWRLLPSQVPSKPNPKNDSQLLGSSPNPFEPVIESKQQPQHCFFSSDIGSPGTLKQEPQHPMRSFFDEWPTSKESWSNLDEGSSKNNFSTTQLSISIPNAPSGFSSRSAPSPKWWNFSIFIYLSRYSCKYS